MMMPLPAAAQGDLGFMDAHSKYSNAGVAAAEKKDPSLQRAAFDDVR
jgi:hypothetical protein